MNLKQTLLAAAFFASVGTQAPGVVGAAPKEAAPAWTRVKVRLGKAAPRKTAAAKPGAQQAGRTRTYCCGNCGTCGVRG
ncbi:hypothetical protein EPO15_10625 [bacterium]|nr:MAG: hypothetical protein EPO15_10625 [bacterium]